MGIFDVVQDILGTKNNYHVDPLKLNEFDYNEALKKSQEAALGSINQGNVAGANQGLLNQQLMDQANGVGPSLAQLQLQSASDDNIKNTAGLIASQRGMNPANAARAIALSGQAQGQDLVNKSAQLRLQEQLQKQQLLAQNLSAQRGQDIGQQGQNQSLFGLTGQLNQGQNAQNMQNYYQAHGINSGIAAANQAGANQLLGMGISAAGAAMGMPSMPSGMGGGKVAPTGGGFNPSAPLSGGFDFSSNPVNYQNTGTGSIGLGGNTTFFSGGEKLGTSNAVVSPGEKIIEPDGDVKSVGGVAQVRGDHPANDTVPVFLEDGSVVVPRSKAKNKKEMFDFLMEVKSKNKPSNELKDLLMKREQINSRLKDISGLKNRFFDGGVSSGLNQDQVVPSQPMNETPVDINLKNPMVLGMNTVENSPEYPLNNSQDDKVPFPSAPKAPSYDLSGGYNMAKQAEQNYSQGIDSTNAKIDDIAEQARIKAEERNKEIDQMANEKINTGRYWGDMSTPDKIRSTIAIMLGGIGAGLTGGKNTALEMINNAMKEDIEAQKADKNSMYNSLIAKGKNDEYATASVMKSMSNQVDSLAKKYAAGANTANQLQNLQQISAQMAAHQDSFNKAQEQTAALDEIVNKAVRGDELTAKEVLLLPPEAQKRHVSGYPLLKDVPTEDNKKALRSQDNIVKGLKNLINTAGVTVWTSEQDRINQANLKDIQLEMKNAYELGVLSASDMDILSQITADPGALRNSNAKAVLQTALNNMNKKKSTLLKSLGVEWNPIEHKGLK